MRKTLLAVIGLVAVSFCLAQAGQQSPSQQPAAPPPSSSMANMPASGPGAPEVMTPDTLKWTTFVPGVQMAVLSGDPNASGPYSLRLKMVGGNQIAPHWHPQDENLTVISGTLQVGMGDKFDASALKSLPVGSHALVPKEMRHYAKASGETVIELYGEGPFAINYVNPADDPRNAKH